MPLQHTKIGRSFNWQVYCILCQKQVKVLETSCRPPTSWVSSLWDKLHGDGTLADPATHTLSTLISGLTFFKTPHISHICPQALLSWPAYSAVPAAVLPMNSGKQHLRLQGLPEASRKWTSLFLCLEMSLALLCPSICAHICIPA